MKVKWFVDDEEYICAEENGESSRIFKCAEGIDPYEIVKLFVEAQAKFEEGSGGE